MELDLLLEQHAELTNKIQHSIDSIKHWFKNKIEECKELFNETKQKVMKKFEKLNKQDLKGKRLKENIEDKNGNPIAKKGESAEMVFNRFKKMILNLLTKLKSQCDKIIRECQKGLRHLIGISDSKLAERNLIIIEEHKKNVVEEITDTAATVTLISNFIAGIGMVTVTAVRVNKVLNNIERNKKRRDDQREKDDAIEAEFSVV